jgi:phosphopantothenoylcysteine decarboxylase/phosphopantothenate--cysteine ligase
MAPRKNLDKLNILLGVTGGIAAYKAVDLASKLTAAGAKVVTVMTKNACRLVQPISFQAVTGNEVLTSLWHQPENYKIQHIQLAEAADVVIVAPATANIIAKIACGICDDLLSTILATCWKKPIILAPAMNQNMWTNPVVQKNVGLLRQMNLRIIGPETGRLACGTEGIGRMAEPAQILAAVEKIAQKLKQR